MTIPSHFIPHKSYEECLLIDTVDNPRNSGCILSTLEECDGHLTSLPALKPNVDRSKPQTIANMVNILTVTTANALLKQEELKYSGEIAEIEKGEPLSMYKFDKKNEVVMKLASSAKTSHMTAPFPFGHVVKPGFISFYKNDGRTYAVPEGRWMLPNPKAKWVAHNIPLNQDLISPSGTQVIIVRVPVGAVGRIWDQGVGVLLDEGTHVFNGGQITVDKTISFKDSVYINHDDYHYLRVLNGEYAKIWAEIKDGDGVTSLKPRLVKEGEHMIQSDLFVYSGIVKVSEQYIGHGSMHQLNVPKGSLAKVWQDNMPRLLREGIHIIESTNFRFDGIVSIAESPCITHGTITIFRVPRGEVGLAWDNNEPMFFEQQGIYEEDSPDFSFVEYRAADEPLIKLGAKKIAFVQTGQVGVSYDEGTLKILPQGKHTIESATHWFKGFLSTQQKSIRLATYSSNQKIANKIQLEQRTTSKKVSTSTTNVVQDSTTGMAFNYSPDQDYDLAICETKDLVKVGLRSDVFYSIDDPEKCINKIDVDELEDLIRETSVAALTNIVRSTALNQIAQSQIISAKSGEIEVLPPAGQTTTAVFFQRVHDEFMAKLHDDFMINYGVNIANIRIESFKIMDEELSRQISQHVLTTAKIENEMANLEGNHMVSTARERTAADVAIISAEAKAAALKTEHDAANERLIQETRARADAMRIKLSTEAEAEAEAILIKAKAEADAIRLKAEAEAKRAEMLSQTVFGQQEALLEKYSDMIVQSNAGVEKVIYLDPSINRESPFALGSLQNLNFDLNNLSQLAIASREANRNGGKTKLQAA
ncbi:hypothetical protein ACHAW6_007814 [Cyclotella cf. meneghiniana]